MTKIKLCGLSRPCDIETVNRLMPEYIGFVFASKSSRYVTYEQAAKLKQMLAPSIKAVGVFVNEEIETTAGLLNSGIIDAAQLHGSETEEYISELRACTGRPVIKAFRIEVQKDVSIAENSSADHILLDSGAGTGTVFDWDLLRSIRRPYFLAGGLTIDNIACAVKTIHPYAVDVSSGIETNGLKDKQKMAAFVAAVRREE